VPTGQTRPVGVIQLWKVESDFSVAEWGFVLSEQYWGSGLFKESAQLLLELAFRTLGVHRLEARIAERNVRGHAVLGRLGATREARLRESFRIHDTYEDHVLWALIADDWREIAIPVH